MDIVPELMHVAGRNMCIEILLMAACVSSRSGSKHHKAW